MTNKTRTGMYESTMLTKIKTTLYYGMYSHKDQTDRIEAAGDGVVPTSASHIMPGVTSASLPPFH